MNVHHLSTIWRQLGGNFETNFGQLWNNFRTALGQLYKNVETTLGWLWDKFGQLSDNLNTTLRQVCDNFETTLIHLWNNFEITLRQLWDDFRTTLNIFGTTWWLLSDYCRSMPLPCGQSAYGHLYTRLHVFHCFYGSEESTSEDLRRVLWHGQMLQVGQFNVELLGNLVAAGFSSPGVNKYEATLTAYMPRNSIVQVHGNPMKYHCLHLYCWILWNTI